QANPSQPCHWQCQCNVVKAAGVVFVSGQRPVGQRGTDGVTDSHCEQVGVENLPLALAADPERNQSGKEGYLLGKVSCIEVVAISDGIGYNILPGNYDEDIDIEPPHQQQR